MYRLANNSVNPEVHKFSKNLVAILKILGHRCVIRSKFHAEDFSRHSNLAHGIFVFLVSVVREMEAKIPCEFLYYELLLNSQKLFAVATCVLSAPQQQRVRLTDTSLSTFERFVFYEIIYSVN